jgi:hypothetical protein
MRSAFRLPGVRPSALLGLAKPSQTRFLSQAPIPPPTYVTVQGGRGGKWLLVVAAGLAAADIVPGLREDEANAVAAQDALQHPPSPPPEPFKLARPPVVGLLKLALTSAPRALHVLHGPAGSGKSSVVLETLGQLNGSATGALYVDMAQGGAGAVGPAIDQALGYKPPFASLLAAARKKLLSTFDTQPSVDSAGEVETLGGVL